MGAGFARPSDAFQRSQPNRPSRPNSEGNGLVERWRAGRGLIGSGGSSLRLAPLRLRRPFHRCRRLFTSAGFAIAAGLLTTAGARVCVLAGACGAAGLAAAAGARGTTIGAGASGLAAGAVAVGAALATAAAGAVGAALVVAGAGFLLASLPSGQAKSSARPMRRAHRIALDQHLGGDGIAERGVHAGAAGQHVGIARRHRQRHHRPGQRPFRRAGRMSGTGAIGPVGSDTTARLFM